MKRLRLIGLMTLATGLLGLFAMAETKKVTEPDMEESKVTMIVIVDSITGEPIYPANFDVSSYFDDDEQYDDDSLDEYLAEEYAATVKKINEDPYIRDKGAAADFAYILKYQSGSKEEEEVMAKLQALCDQHYPYAELLMKDKLKYDRTMTAIDRYFNDEPQPVSPEDLNLLGLYCMAYLDEDNPEEPIAPLEEAWAGGCKAAASSLTTAYYSTLPEGFNNENNRKKAIEWAQKGAEAGDPKSLYNMGRFHEEGIIMPYDLKLAAEYYEKAAALNEPEALSRLADMYASGMGVNQDLEKAVSLKERAAENGDTRSIFNRAAVELEKGNYDKTKHYLNLALMNGELEIYKRLADQILTQGDGSPLRSNPEKVEFLKFLYSDGMTNNEVCNIGNIRTILELLDADWEAIEQQALTGDRLSNHYMIWDAQYGLVSQRDRDEAMRRLENLVKQSEEYRFALAVAYLNQYGKVHDVKKAKYNYEIITEISNSEEIDSSEVYEGYPELSPLRIELWGSDAYPDYDINTYRLLNLVNEEIVKKLDRLIGLESRKADILKKAKAGDPQAMYDMYELTSMGIYNPELAPGIRYSPLGFLIQAAQAGYKPAFRELSGYYDDKGKYPEANYWKMKAEENK